MQKKIRFSIAFLLLLTLVCALFAMWFVTPGDRIHKGHVKWTQMGILKHSVALVDATFPPDAWDVCAVSSGAGSFCQIAEGQHWPGSTAASYYSLGIQLPRNLTAGWSTDLRAIAERPDGIVRKMVAGEIVAMEFGNPAIYVLMSGIAESLGTLTVIEVDDNQATLQIVAKIPVQETTLTGHIVELDIDETFVVAFFRKADPFAEIPKVSHFSKD